MLTANLAMVAGKTRIARMKLKQIRSVIGEDAETAGRRKTAAPAAEDDAQVPGTAARMLEIAERLFAEHGVEQVPLRQIVIESGQRNRSALHYHFGSREALVSHLLNRRLHQINVIRHRYLDRLVAEGRDTDLHAVVESTILPLADAVRDTDWGRHYLQVLAQTTFSPNLLKKGLVERDAVSALIRVRKLVFTLCPQVPREVMNLRLTWFNDTVVYSLAHWYRDQGRRGGEPPLSELIDFCAASLSAPVGSRVGRR